MTTQLGVNSNLNVFSLLSHIKPHVLDNIFLCSQRDGFILPHVFQGFVHVIARVLNVKLRRYALAPIDELKEKFKDYGLTTLGGRRQLETGAGPLCDMMDQIRQLNQRVTQLEELHKCCCYGIVLKFLFGNDFQSQLSAVLLQLRCCYWFASAGGYSQMLWLCRHTYWSLNTNV